MTLSVTPRDWPTSTIVTARDINEIRDELTHLFDHASNVAFDYPHTVDPCIGDDLASVGTANDCHYNRVYHGGQIDTIRIVVGVSNGTISVAAYSSDGGTRSLNKPSARIATSGSVACPAAGGADVSIAATITLGHFTHWMALSASGTTATFRSANAVPAGWHMGVNWAQATGHPAPNPAVPASSRASQAFTMVGIP